MFSMPVVVGLLRGVNVGGNCKLPMATLRSLCDALGHEGAVTYIQSGNVVFRTKKRDLAKVATDLEDAIQAEVGFRPAVALRTSAALAEVIAANPFRDREGLQGGRLLVTFLMKDPGEAAREKVRGVDVGPEELYAVGSELYTYYVEGLGKTKLPFRLVDKAIGCSGTARNWNTVLKLAEMARAMEA